MRSFVAVVCLVLGGCNLLFRAKADPEGVDAPRLDAPDLDAPLALGITLEIADPVFVEGAPTTVPIVVKTTGDRPVFIRLAADAGDFPASPANPTTIATTAKSGAQETTIMWRTPSQFASVRFDGRVSYDVAFDDLIATMRTIEVHSWVGHYTISPPASAQPVPMNKLIAAPFQLNKQGTVVELGVQVVSVPDVHVKLALYASDGNVPPRPQGLVAVTGSLDVGAGTRIMGPVTPVQLAAGMYWVALISDKAFNVIGSNSPDNPVEVARNATFMLDPPSPFGTNITIEQNTLGVYARITP